MGLPFIGDLFKTVTGGLDSLLTNDEERLEAQAKLKKLEVEIETSLNEHMNKVVEAQSSAMKLEYEKGSWIARNWRPMLMVLFGTIIGYNYLLLPFSQLIVVVADLDIWLPQAIDIPEKMWTLLTMGVGGYIVGRSGEKMADKWRKKR